MPLASIVRSLELVNNAAAAAADALYYKDNNTLLNAFFGIADT